MSRPTETALGVSDGGAVDDAAVEPAPAQQGSLLELASRRRSIRSFDRQRDVPPELVLEVLEPARWAPSAGNAQPWEYLVIRSPEMRGRIVDLYLDQVRTKAAMEEIVWKQKLTTGNVGFRHAPVLILALADMRVVTAFPVRTIREKGRDHIMSSMAHANILVHLAAAERGLATQWVSDVSSPYMSTVLKGWLDIPQHIEVYDMIPLGWPASTPAPTPRRPLAEIVHHERYDPLLERDEAALDDFLWTQTRLASFGSRPRPPGARANTDATGKPGGAADLSTRTGADR